MKTYLESSPMDNPKKTKKQRIESIDILRGFALIGILFANILWFSGYLDSTAELRDQQLNTSLADGVVLYLTRLLVHGKFYFIYSFLFGLGFYILYSRTKIQGRAFNLYFLKRQVILLIIGCVHAFFIWWGDILRYYALVGMVMLLIKDWSPARLLQLSVTLLFMPLILDLLHLFYGLSVELSFAPDFSKGQILTQYLNGQWFDANLIRVIMGLEGNLNTGRLLRILGMFVLGYYFGQMNFFSVTEANRTLQKRIMTFSLVVAFPAGLIKVGASYFDYGISESLKTAVMEFLYVVSVTGMALGYIAMVAYFAPGLQNSRPAIWLKTLGKVPLSNYLLQSVIGVLIFQVFDLFAKVPLTQAYALSAGIIVVQIYISSLWLKYRSQGPVEALWRKLASR
ncbi:DUF418 domain-containing protein [Endozoicomonas arenosclerae]|uniref:DUF418 domain-containing protein n=1 Tax=Endozoicomonas arenosclerae TaxID=1633495 RepID=UPI00156194C1|nr:DUF418 domain-containing protein [Endozoicomonas arenosclerae]